MFHNRKKISIILTVIMMCALLGAAAAPVTAASLSYKVSFYGEEKQDEAYKLLNILNKSRSSKLQWDRDLEDAARTRAAEIAFYNNISKRPNGTSWSTVSAKVQSVNIAPSSSTATAESVNQRWMENDGCKSIRVAGDVRSYGAAAIKTENGSVYYVELFGSDKPTNSKNSDNITKGQKTINIIDSSLYSLSARLENSSEEVLAPDSFNKNDQCYMKLTSKNIKGIGDRDQVVTVTNPAGNSFSSSNPAVATVDSNGKITCKAAGTAKITGALHSSSAKKTSITITVSDSTIADPATVTFKEGTSNIGSQTVEKGNAVTPPTPKKSGYTFTGWYTAETGGSKITDFSNITTDMTAYARFERIKVTVKFMNGSSTVKSSTVYLGESVAAPKVTKKGYTFTGWYTAKTGGKKVSNFQNLQSNLTVYAHLGKNPAKPALSLKSPKKKQLKVTYSKLKGISGYQVYYSTKSSKQTSKLYTGSKTTIYKTLKSKKVYYVKVRAYATKDGVKCYGDWSKAKRIKIK